MNTNKIGVLGTGMVGATIATKLIELGHEVMMGSRTSTNEKATEWAKLNGDKASKGNFAETTKFGDIIFNCCKGEFSLEVIRSAKAENLKNKILVDISNPLDFSKGMPPSLLPGLSNTNSLGEEIQKILPDTYVVKTLNIVNCEVMVDASKCGGEATMFIAGNNASSKKEVERILHQFGWSDVIDLGDIQHSRSTEMLLPIWVSTYMVTKNSYIGFKIVRH